MSSDVVVSNVIYQQMPFDGTTGTFDASATPLVLFQEPNVISVGFALPK